MVAIQGEETRQAGRLPQQVDVAIVGAGVIGLSIGWRLARRGLAVVIVEAGTAGCGASLAASGMLAASTEVEPGEDDLLALNLESQRLWPGFRDELEAAAGERIGYRSEGTLVAALSRDEIARLRFRFELHERAGLPSRWLDGEALREMEPGLRPSAVGAIFCSGDHQVDPPRVVSALVQAFRGAGGHLVEHCRALDVERRGGRADALLTEKGLCHAGTIIVAAGAWSADSGLLPAGEPLPVRPLKGQSLALRMRPEAPILDHVLWTEQVHLAPKSDGRLIVGATVEEAGFDAANTAGGVFALLEGARRALPGIEELELIRTWTGFRPTSTDDAPILGPTGLNGLIVATGHHRNGYLLAPVTALAIEDLITVGKISGAAAGFSAERFREAGSTGAPISTLAATA